ncbi:MAG: hypothetical protein KAW16_09505, partial [candidate division Zixibacteria bacterium]|nr:hypothetical protein [candidate division Zixibacteria bacterium]
MCPLKSKPVLGQAFVIVCLLLALLVFEPGTAISVGELDPVHPNLFGNPANGGIGRNSLASIRIDTVSQIAPSDYVEIPILIRNDAVFGKFELQVDFCYPNLTFMGAERGEALWRVTDEEYDWEYFNYRLLPYTDSLHRCLILGVYDLPDAHQGVPLAPHSEYISLVVLRFVIHYGGFPDGTFLPIIFEWEVDDCLENTFENPSFDTLYVSQDSAQFSTIDCPPESLEYLSVSSSLEFSDGGVSIFYPDPPVVRGDINLNWIPYEVADLVLFSHYLLYGDSVLIDPEAQSANSDVNWDDFAWSMADFIHLGRVIGHDAPEVVEPTSQSEYHLDTWMTTVHALPNDTVVLPVWYEGEGTESVHGISFKIDYDPDSLTLLEVDFSETSLENWEGVYIRLENGSIRLN